MVDSRNPLISIIIAAYNRSNVLHYAIMSVIQQTFTNWELLIVDDASTDDTSAVAASFKDERIRYIRHEKNTGGQSEPHNEGFRQSRGHFIAYISQDDLWFPDHLEKQLTTIQTSHADWVFSLGFVVIPHGKVVMSGIMPGGVYNPRYTPLILASLWFLRREVIEELGGWLFYRAIRISPSQDFIQRAWKAKKKIVMTPYPTVILFHSGHRPNSYLNRESNENRDYYAKLCSDPDLRESMMLSSLLAKESEFIKGAVSCTEAFSRFITTVAFSTLHFLGIRPANVYYYFRYFKKGSYVDSLRKVRGLPPLKHNK
jgi:glycosyltransferase involved in cell wall biosynthesis